MLRHIPQPPAPKKLFVFGMGYSALALAKRCKARGWRVAGTRRTKEGAAELAALGIEAHAFDGAAPLRSLETALAGVTHLLQSIPPDREGDPVLRHHRGDIAAAGSLNWIGYLSSTVVYGDRGGDWVDERAALHPTSARGRARVEAEGAWLYLQRLGAAPHVFRLASIYGPGRNALAEVKAGRARRIVKPGQVFSRIHVDDIASVLEASMARPDPGAIYNLCDDEPAPPQDVIAYAAALLDREPPPEIAFADARRDMSEMGRSFYEDNKRVANRRIKDELGVNLAYPDYRAGLKALVKTL